MYLFKNRNMRALSSRIKFYQGKRLLHGECLSNRGLIKVEGLESRDFLQGLITNDINHLNPDRNIPSIYVMFLNVQGRILFDSIIYKDTEDSYIIDCDLQAVQPLVNHMKLYKVRRKINFEILKDFSVWVIFDNDIDLKKFSSADLETMYFSTKRQPNWFIKEESNLPSELIVTRDPRLHYLGDRILAPSHISLKDFSNFGIVNGGFEKFRFKLGVGEGISELIKGKSFPLEANCDYLHGVSFQKGCYIGQELTARTYHTGVVRKRIMPLIVNKGNSIQSDATITNENGKIVGKVIKIIGQLGIGLLRVNETLQSQKLKIGEIAVETFRPGWWPIEASKYRQA